MRYWGLEDHLQISCKKTVEICCTLELTSERAVFFTKQHYVSPCVANCWTVDVIWFHQDMFQTTASTAKKEIPSKFVRKLFHAIAMQNKYVHMYRYIYIYIPTNYCIGERLNFVVCRDLVFCKRCSRGSAELNIAAWNQHVNMKQFGYPCPVSMFSYKICASMRSMFLVSGMMCVCMCCFLFVIMRFFLEWRFRFPSRCERILWCFCWRKLFFCEISVSKATGLSFPVFGVFGARIWVKFASSWFF